MFLAFTYFPPSTQTVLQEFSTIAAVEAKQPTITPLNQQVPERWIAQNKAAGAVKSLPTQLQNASQCFNVKKIVSLDVKNKTGSFRGKIINCVFTKNSLVVGQDVPGQKDTRFFFHVTFNGYQRKDELSALSTLFTERPAVIAVIHDQYVDQSFNGKECTYTLPAEDVDPNLITLANSLKDCQPFRKAAI